jgi:hypothetical protein
MNERLTTGQPSLEFRDDDSAQMVRTASFEDTDAVSEPITEWHMSEAHPERAKQAFRETVSQAASNTKRWANVDNARGAAAHSLHAMHWLPSYNVGMNLVGDLAAGLTVGVVLIAQGVAYGLLTGMKPYYGLYTGIAPAFVYALLGTSRQMHIGPFALVGQGIAIPVLLGQISITCRAWAAGLALGRGRCWGGPWHKYRSLPGCGCDARMPGVHRLLPDDEPARRPVLHDDVVRSDLRGWARPLHDAVWEMLLRVGVENPSRPHFAGYFGLASSSTW